MKNEEKLELALRHDPALPMDVFSEIVVVQHSDGSCFTFQNAHAILEPDHLTIHWEHGHPIVFLREDLHGHWIEKPRCLK